MKHMYRLLLFASAIILMSFVIERTDKPDREIINRIKQEAFDNSKVMETLFQITDVTGPRLTGSTGLRHAQDWVRKQLSDWGLVNAQLERWGGFGKGWETQKCY